MLKSGLMKSQVVNLAESGLLGHLIKWKSSVNSVVLSFLSSDPLCQVDIHR